MVMVPKIRVQSEERRWQKARRFTGKLGRNYWRQGRPLERPATNYTQRRNEVCKEISVRKESGRTGAEIPGQKACDHLPDNSGKLSLRRPVGGGVGFQGGRGGKLIEGFRVSESHLQGHKVGSKINDKKFEYKQKKETGPEDIEKIPEKKGVLLQRKP